MMSVMSSIISVILGGGWYLTLPIEGDECEGEDKDGVYIIDEDGKCVLDYCNPGYVKSGQKCMYDDIVEDETGYMPPGSVTDEAEGSGEDISQTPSSTMDTCSGECPGGLTSANGMYNFIMQEDGSYKPKGNGGARSQYLIAAELGGRFALMGDVSTEGPQLTFKFVSYMQGTYVNSYVPLLPINSFQICCKSMLNN